MKLSEFILKYREEHGLSQRQFAKQCGNITAGYISMIENEANPTTKKKIVPSIEKMASVANGMGMTLHELLTQVDDLDVAVNEENTVHAPLTTAVLYNTYFTYKMTKTY